MVPDKKFFQITYFWLIFFCKKKEKDWQFNRLKINGISSKIGMQSCKQENVCSTKMYT